METDGALIEQSVSITVAVFRSVVSLLLSVFARSRAHGYVL